jgi:lipoyl(octanoyl) transferase
MTAPLLSELLTPQEKSPSLIACLGKQAYRDTYEAMQLYTSNRTATCPDQIWLVEHPPVFTQGKTSNPLDILTTLPAPLISTDRGGKITYHGPGQLVAYFLLDLKRHPELGLRKIINTIEEIILNILDFYGIKGYNDPSNRGIYYQGKKMASLGLRVKNHCCYHGFALNVCMDTTPFSAIKPCGLSMDMTQIADHHPQTREIVSVCIDNITQSLAMLGPFTLLKNTGEQLDVNRDRQIAW